MSYRGWCLSFVCFRVRSRNNFSKRRLFLLVARVYRPPARVPREDPPFNEKRKSRRVYERKRRACAVCEQGINNEEEKDAIRVSFRVSFAGSLRVATTSRYKWRRLCRFPLFRFSSPFAAGVSFYAVLRVLLSFLFANDICYLDCFLQTIDSGKICVTCFITCSTDLYPRDYNA